MNEPLRRGRLSYIRSYWSRPPNPNLTAAMVAEMAQRHISELVGEVERLWELHGCDEEPLEQADIVCRRRTHDKP